MNILQFTKLSQNRATCKGVVAQLSSDILKNPCNSWPPASLIIGKGYGWPSVGKRKDNADSWIGNIQGNPSNTNLTTTYFCSHYSAFGGGLDGHEILSRDVAMIRSYSRGITFLNKISSHFSYLGIRCPRRFWNCLRSPCMIPSIREAKACS